MPDREPIFLRLSEVLKLHEFQGEQLTLGVANGTVDKQAVTDFFRRLTGNE